MDNLMEKQVRIVIAGTFLGDQGLGVNVSTQTLYGDEATERALTHTLLTTAAAKTLMLDGYSKDKIAEILMAALDAVSEEAEEA